MSKTYIEAKHIEIGTLLVALIAVWLLFVFVKDITLLILNSIIAIIIMLLLNIIFGLGIPINIISILVVAIGGIVGLLLVLIFRFSNMAFYIEKKSD